MNPPVADPSLSPSVQPRNVTFDKTHTYAAACLYDLVVTVGDDDGGTANDTVAVVVRGNGTISKGSGTVVRGAGKLPYTITLEVQ